MTVKDLKEKFERLTAESECTIYYCAISEEEDFLEILHKGIGVGYLWTVDYIGSLSEYLRQETELEEFRKNSSAPTGEKRRMNRPPRTRYVEIAGN